MMSVESVVMNSLAVYIIVVVSIFQSAGLFKEAESQSDLATRLYSVQDTVSRTTATNSIVADAFLGSSLVLRFTNSSRPNGMRISCTRGGARDALRPA